MMIARVALTCTLCFLVNTGATSLRDLKLGEKSVEVEKVAEPVEHGEGPYWDMISQKLYYVDMSGQKIIRYDPVTGNRTYIHFTSGSVGGVVRIEGTSDKFIVAIGRNVIIVTWDGKHNVDDPPYENLVSLDTDRNDTRVNDGKCDPAGRFWIGTMAFKINSHVTPNRGSLYRIDKDGSKDKVISPTSISNGLTWSLENEIMYYIDTATFQIWAFDYNIVDGTLSSKRVIFYLKKNNIVGQPDGMTNDADGNLWIALFKGKAVIQIDPKKGKLLRIIEMPVDEVTSIAFGGSQLDDLYVTTSRSEKTAEELQENPDSGSLYRVKNLGVRGVPSNNYKYSPQ